MITTLSNKKALVTGGAGFIGSALVKSLLERGIEKIYIIDNLSTGRLENITGLESDNKIEFIKDSITNKDIFNKIPRVDFVFNLAAIVSVPKSFQEPDITHHVNTNGFQNVLEFCRKKKVSKLLYASSSAVYGEPLESKPLSESDPTSPLSPYGLSKYINEQYAYSYNLFYGINSIGFRFFNVFGPKQRADSPYSGVISIFKSRMENDLEINIYGDGMQIRDFIFVQDVVDCLISASLSDNKLGIYNLGTGIPLSVNVIFEQMAFYFNYRRKALFYEKREGDIKYSLADISKLKNELDFHPKYTFKDGLEKLD